MPTIPMAGVKRQTEMNPEIGLQQPGLSLLKRTLAIPMEEETDRGE